MRPPLEFRPVFHSRGLPQPYDAACGPQHKLPPEQIVLSQPRSFHPPTGRSPADPRVCVFSASGLIVGYDELDVPAKFLPRESAPAIAASGCDGAQNGHHFALHIKCCLSMVPGLSSGHVP